MSNRKNSFKSKDSKSHSDSELEENKSSDSDSDEEEISSEELQKAVQLASEALANTFRSNEKTGRENSSSKQQEHTSKEFSSGFNLNRIEASGTKNPLTELIPGYIAKMKLDSSDLDQYKSNITTQLKHVQTIDESTKDFTLHNSKSSLNTTIHKLAKPTHARNLHAGSNTSTTHSAGPQWFNMTSTPMTDELKTDLRILAYRNYLDPKKFYKSADKASKSKHRIIQLGTVIEGHGEFYSNRLSQKERRMNLTEEIMNDSGVSRYTTKTYHKISVENERKGKGGTKRKGQRYKFKR